jgi:hypothetical protein
MATLAIVMNEYLELSDFVTKADVIKLEKGDLLVAFVRESTTDPQMRELIELLRNKLPDYVEVLVARSPIDFKIYRLKKGDSDEGS